MTDAIKDAVEKGAEAHTDLVIFDAIENLLDSSLVTTETQSAADRIIAICQKEKARCLKRYDAAVAGVAEMKDSSHD